MTRTSALFGGDDVIPYISNNVYPLNRVGSAAAASTPDEDWLAPFIPRRTVAVDGVAWVRDQETAANVYVGIYSAAGALLTNCAVDAATETGTHVVSTTQLTLVRNTLYYFAWNASADVATIKQLSTAIEGSYQHAFDYGASSDLTTGVVITGNTLTLSYSKARTNAALLSSLTMSGWTSETNQVAMGFRVV